MSVGRNDSVRQRRRLTAVKALIFLSGGDLPSTFVQQPQPFADKSRDAVQSQGRRVVLDQLSGEVSIDASLHDHCRAAA